MSDWPIGVIPLCLIGRQNPCPRRPRTFHGRERPGSPDVSVDIHNVGIALGCSRPLAGTPVANRWRSGCPRTEQGGWCYTRHHMPRVLALRPSDQTTVPSHCSSTVAGDAGTPLLQGTPRANSGVPRTLGTSISVIARKFRYSDSGVAKT